MDSWLDKELDSKSSFSEWPQSYGDDGAVSSSATGKASPCSAVPHLRLDGIPKDADWLGGIRKNADCLEMSPQSRSPSDAADDVATPDEYDCDAEDDAATPDHDRTSSAPTAE